MSVSLVVSFCGVSNGVVLIDFFPVVLVLVVLLFQVVFALLRILNTYYGGNYTAKILLFQVRHITFLLYSTCPLMSCMMSIILL